MMCVCGVLLQTPHVERFVRDVNTSRTRCEHFVRAMNTYLRARCEPLIRAVNIGHRMGALTASCTL